MGKAIHCFLPAWSVYRHALVGHRHCGYIAAPSADQADTPALLELGSIVAMIAVELELRLHELIHPATQGDVWLTEQIGIDRVNHAGDLEALVLEPLIRRYRVVAVGLDQLLSADFAQRLSRRHHLGRHALIAADRPAGGCARWWPCQPAPARQSRRMIRAGQHYCWYSSSPTHASRRNNTPSSMADYGMQDGQLVIETRGALVQYVLHALSDRPNQGACQGDGAADRNDQPG